MTRTVTSCTVLATLSIFLGSAEARSEAWPNSVVCEFREGTQLAIDLEGDYDPIQDAHFSEGSAYLFSGLATGGGVGQYRNLKRDWEGEIYVLADDLKINLVEKAPTSDNAFIATIFAKGRSVRSYPAIVSRHSFQPGIAAYNPQQLLGWCR